jgi:hypothetical protein
MELGGAKLLADSPLTAKFLLGLASTVIVYHIVLSHGSEGIPRVFW